MCSVVVCNSWNRNVRRFKLPEDPEKRLEWVQFLFEVNGQRLKESSWTDITICSEHFTHDCFVNLSTPGVVQLKPGAVPSLCLKYEPEEPELDQEPLDLIEVAIQCDQIKTCNSPTYESEHSSTVMSDPQSPVPSQASDLSLPDYGHMLEKVENLDMIREKAALLQKKGRYVVNENRLLQLFVRKCPFCSSKVKVEKVVHGVLLVLNKQCLQCDYKKQWTSQVNASVPADGEGTEVTLEIADTDDADDGHSSITGEIVAVVDECAPMDETEESSEEADVESDEDWKPPEEHLLTNELYNESDEDSANENDDDDPLLSSHDSQLCTDCGMFFDKRKSHTCKHKVKPYSCNICGKRCVSEVALNAHSKIHDENYQHPCKYCNVTFKTKVDKVTHEQTHLTEENPYKCPDCSETFASFKKRRIHLQHHRGPKQFKCPVCGIEFFRPLAYRRHLIVHTGAKPYICSVCQRGFNQAGHLKSHMRLHTGERPYKCQHCDKCFNHNVSLKSHVQRYHTSTSGPEKKKGKKNKRETDTGDAQGNGNEGGADSGPDTEEEVQKKSICRPKKKRRSTGRPIGRPKKNTAGNLVQEEEMQGQGSNTKTAKVKARKSKRTHFSDEESEDEPSESDVSFASLEEGSEKVTTSARRSKGRPPNSDNDSDFDPAEVKKKRGSSQSITKGSSKHSGRPRKKVEDT